MKQKTTVNTQLARITVEDLSGDNMGVTVLEIPAYTRTWLSFQRELERLHGIYMERSKEIINRPSIGDFAFWLLSAASLEPKEQSEDA